MVTVYGIRNCDTCRKALKWLSGKGIEHRFVDFRSDGLDRATVAGWVGELGVDSVLNRRSTTWRGLDDAEREGLDEDGAIALLTREPTLIKRPVIAGPDGVTVGFDDRARARFEGRSVQGQTD